MCDLDKMLKVAENYFSKDSTIVSIGLKRPGSPPSETTVLLGGRVEFNSYIHRRDAFDIMLKYNLYVKKNPSGLYEAGSHDAYCQKVQVSKDPLDAITEMAYLVVTGQL